MNILVKARMIRDFARISAEQSPKQAVNSLPKQNRLVVVEDQEVPIVLISVHDLEQAAARDVDSMLQPAADLPPTIIVGAMFDIASVARAWEDQLTCTRCRGAIVLGVESIESVLAADAALVLGMAS